MIILDIGSQFQLVLQCFLPKRCE